MKTQQLITIKESDLELVVSEKTLGSLTTNAIQIRDMVKSTSSHLTIYQTITMTISTRRREIKLLSTRRPKFSTQNVLKSKRNL